MGPVSFDLFSLLMLEREHLNQHFPVFLKSVAYNREFKEYNMLWSEWTTSILNPSIILPVGNLSSRSRLASAEVLIATGECANGSWCEGSE
jgi:hypothetical protein